MPVFRARYKGSCAKCGVEVQPGEYVSWSRRQKGVVYHPACIGVETPDSEPTAQPDRNPPTAPSNESAPAEPTPASRMDDDAVRVIAREVASELDAAMTGALIHAIEERMAKHVPATLNVKVHHADGTVVELKLDNVHHKLKTLVYLVGKRKHVYMFGPPGSGKSTAAVQAAKALGLRYGYVSLNPQTPESRLLGFIDAGGVYRETEFFRCYTAGGVFCIDELDNGHAALLNTLNGMLETDADGVGRGAFPSGVVERHPDFVCVATGNTTGRGADKLFPERRALDAAFMERFTALAWEYDEALEKALTLRQNKEHGPAWLKWVRSVRSYVGKNGIRLFATPRASVNGAALLRDMGGAGFATARDIADAVLFKGLDSDTVARIVGACPLPPFEDTVKSKAVANV